MKVTIEKCDDIKDVEIIIKCKEKDEEVDKILSTLDLINKNIIGKDEEGRSCLIDPTKIFYFESVDDKVFCYTIDKVYETKYRLYELEEILIDTVFIRINKNTILNISKVQNFKPTLNGRMEAVLKNKEKLEISRNYVQSLKKTLGGKQL